MIQATMFQLPTGIFLGANEVFNLVNIALSSMNCEDARTLGCWRQCRGSREGGISYLLSSNDGSTHLHCRSVLVMRNLKNTTLCICAEVVP
jgi:hypothetical protein